MISRGEQNGKKIYYAEKRACVNISKRVCSVSEMRSLLKVGVKEEG